MGRKNVLQNLIQILRDGVPHLLQMFPWKRQAPRHAWATLGESLPCRKLVTGGKTGDVLPCFQDMLLDAEFLCGQVAWSVLILILILISSHLKDNRKGSLGFIFQDRRFLCERCIYKHLHTLLASTSTIM